MRPALLNAQITFQRVYGGTGAELGRAVAHTPDGGFLMTGNTSSFGIGQESGWAIKTDAFGNIQWDRTYSGNGTEWLYGGIPYGTGYVLTGNTTSSGAGGQDHWVIRVDANGNPIWNRTFGNNFNSYSRHVTLGVDSSIFIMGYAAGRPPGFGINDYYVARINGNGGLVWDRIIGREANDFPHDMEATPDSGAVIVGYRRDYSGFSQHMGYLVKLDGGGNLTWSAQYGGTSNDRFGNVALTQDGGYILTGATSSYGTGGEDIWLLKLDSAGTVEFARTYGGAQNERGGFVQQMPDRGYLIAGQTESFGAGNSDLFLLRTDSIGIVQWARTYGGPQQETILTIARNTTVLPNGDIAMVGTTTSFGSGNGDFYLVRTDPLGRTPGCNDSLFFPTVTIPNVPRFALTDSIGAPGWGANAAAVLSNPTPDTLVLCCPKPGLTLTTTGGCASDSARFTVTTTDVLPGARWFWDFQNNGSVDDTTSGSTSFQYGAGGTYTVSLIVLNPCGSSDTVLATVNIDSVLSVNLGADQTVCDQNLATLNAGVANGTYLWSTGATTAGIQSGGGTVWVRVNRGACTGSDTVVVNELPPIVVNVLPTLDTICAGDSRQLNTQVSGRSQGQLSWNWNPGTGLSSNIIPSPVASPAVSTTYIVTATDSLGCVESDTVTLLVDEVRVTVNANPLQICQGGLTSLSMTPTQGTGPFTYTWLPGSGVFNPGNANTNALPSGTTTYLGILSNSLGCTDTGSVTVSVFPEPDAAFSFGTQAPCDPNNLMSFTAIGNNSTNATYAWSFQDGTPATSTATIQTVSFASPGAKFVTLVVTQNGCSDTLTQVVTIQNFSPPQVSAGTSASFCEGESGTLLQGTVTGGNAPYYWTWWCDSTHTFCGIDSIFDDDPNVLPDTSTWYYVQVRDNRGCLSTIDSVFVTVIPKPVVDAGRDIFICPDSAPCVNLNPVITGSPGPFSYQWLPATGLSNDTIPNPCARPDTTTIYALVVQDRSTGCSSELTTTDTLATVTVNVHPLPIADAGPDRDICLGDTVELQGFGYNAGPGYQYQWSPLNGMLDPPTIQNPMISPIITTTYSLTAISNGCPSYADSITVTVHALPEANAGPDMEICLGDTGLMDGQAWGDSSSNGQYSYNWIPSIGVIGNTNVEDLIVSPDSNTSYSLVATSIWGCESEPDIAILTVRPTPIAEAGGPHIICEGTPLLLNGSYAYQQGNDTLNDLSQLYYSWTPGTTLNDTTLEDPVANPNQTTLYYLTVRANTCTTTDSVLVTVIPKPDLTLGADTTTICGGDSVQLNAEGGVGNAVFCWSPVASLSQDSIPNPLAGPTTTTTYTVIAKEGGCSDTASITIEVLSAPVAAYMSSLTEGCADFTVQFLQAASDASFYIWDFGDGSPVVNEPNPSHTYTNPGTYTVSLTAVSTGGCESTVSELQVTVTQGPEVEFTSEPTWPAQLYLPAASVAFQATGRFIAGQQGSSGQGSGLAGIHWDFGDRKGTSTLVNPVYTWTEPGTYYVSLYASNELGCSDTVRHGPYQVLLPTLDIPNVFSPNGDGTNDRFRIVYEGIESYSIQIFDRWGRMVYESRDVNSGWDGLNMNGQAAPEGTYYYLIRVGEKEYTGWLTMIR